VSTASCKLAFYAYFAAWAVVIVLLVLAAPLRLDDRPETHEAELAALLTQPILDLCYPCLGDVVFVACIAGLVWRARHGDFPRARVHSCRS
jgi:hypothetical protein